MLNCFCTEAVDQLFAADPGRPADIPHKEGMHDPCHCRYLGASAVGTFETFIMA